MNIKVQIQKLISLGKTEEALELLEQLTSDAVLLQSRFNDAKRQYSMGMIDFSEWSRTQAQVNYNALEVMNSVKTNSIEMNITTTKVSITVNMTTASFTEAIASLPLNVVKEQCLTVFKHSPKMLDGVLDAVAPIERAEATNRPIEVGSVEKAKAELVQLFTEHIEGAAKAKKKEQTGDLVDITQILADEVDESTLLGCYEALEIFLASNTRFSGLSDLQARREKYLNGPIEKILRKSVGRLQPRINEERTWIVEVSNRIIKSLES